MIDVIRAEGLTRKFRSLIAVDSLNLAVKEGEIFGLVGPDGAGKTTTMRLLTAILAPTSGEAWVDGHDIVKDAESVKEKIGYMSQRFGLYSDLTVWENIRFYADIYGVPKKGLNRKIDELLSFSDMLRFKRRRAGRLSGGMKQKLGLCCTLIHTPRVLFLDEPTNGVDPVSRRDFWRMLYQLLRRKVTIFMSTAYLEEAERCSRVALMHQGRVLSCDTPANIKQLMSDQVLEIFVSSPRQASHFLRRHLPGQTVVLFGDKIHMTTPHPEKSTLEVSHLFNRTSHRISGIRTVEPSLEDVFVSVLSERGEDRHEE